MMAGHSPRARPRPTSAAPGLARAYLRLAEALEEDEQQERKAPAVVSLGGDATTGADKTLTVDWESSLALNRLTVRAQDPWGGQSEQEAQDTYANSMYGTAAQSILGQTSANNTSGQNAVNANNSAALNQAGFNNQAALSQRNAPINEISALMGGSQVAQPGFTPQSSVQIPTTDYAGITQNSFQDQMGVYNAQLQQNNAMMGGLFGLGGSAISGGAMAMF